MPFLHLRTTGPALSPSEVRSLQAGLTTLMSTIMRKSADVTSVLIEGAPNTWAIGAKPTPAAAHLDVTITEGTNTPAEKAAFIREAAGLLRQVIPGLPSATYIVLHDISNEAWGYDGLTQAERKRQALAA